MEGLSSCKVALHSTGDLQVLVEQRCVILRDRFANCFTMLLEAAHETRACTCSLTACCAGYGTQSRCEACAQATAQAAAARLCRGPRGVWLQSKRGRLSAVPNAGLFCSSQHLCCNGVGCSRGLLLCCAGCTCWHHHANGCLWCANETCERNGACSYASSAQAAASYVKCVCEDVQSSKVACAAGCMRPDGSK